jgi:hypothetical protein
MRLGNLLTSSPNLPVFVSSSIRLHKPKQSILKYATAASCPVLLSSSHFNTQSRPLYADRIYSIVILKAWTNRLIFFYDALRTTYTSLTCTPSSISAVVDLTASVQMNIQNHITYIKHCKSLSHAFCSPAKGESVFFCHLTAKRASACSERD